VLVSTTSLVTKDEKKAMNTSKTIYTGMKGIKGITTKTKNS
jgi:hypothetical protein